MCAYTQQGRGGGRPRGTHRLGHRQGEVRRPVPAHHAVGGGVVARRSEGAAQGGNRRQHDGANSRHQNWLLGWWWWWWCRHGGRGVRGCWVHAAECDARPTMPVCHTRWYWVARHPPTAAQCAVRSSPPQSIHEHEQPTARAGRAGGAGRHLDVGGLPFRADGGAAGRRPTRGRASTAAAAGGGRLWSACRGVGAACCRTCWT